MATKAVIPRELALQDIEDAVGYYAREVGAHTALGYVEDLQNVYKLVAGQPGVGIFEV